MQHTRAARTSRPGSILIAALLILVILQLVVATMVLSGGREAELSKSRWGQARAYYNADAAAAMSLRELAQNTDLDGDGIIGGISDDGKDSNNPILNGGSLWASWASGTPGTITTSGSAQGTVRGPTLSVTQINYSSITGPTRQGLYFEAWSIPTQTLVNAVNWNNPPATVGCVRDIYWPNQGTGNMIYVGQGKVAARFTGKIVAATAGIYNFGVDIDDDVGLWIDGVQVLLANSNGGCRRISGSITLTAGDHDLVMKMTDGGGSGCLMFWWKPPSAAAFVQVPPSVLKYVPTSRFPGIVATNSVTFTGNNNASNATRTYGWDATYGAYTTALYNAAEGDVAVLSTANNAISVSAYAKINGDAYVGVGGNPNTVVATSTNGSITQSKAAVSTQLAMPIHGLPSGRPASSGALTLSSGTTTISTDKTYSSITLSSSAVLSFTGETVLYVTGDIILNNSSKFTINSGNLLRIYCDGNITVNSTAQLNSSNLPSTCWIFMRGSAKTMSIASQGRINAHVRAPYSAVSFSSASNKTSYFSGTIWAQSFSSSVRTAVRLDCGPLSGSSVPVGNDLVISNFVDP